MKSECASIKSETWQQAYWCLPEMEQLHIPHLVETAMVAQVEWPPTAKAATIIQLTLKIETTHSWDGIWKKVTFTLTVGYIIK